MTNPVSGHAAAAHAAYAAHQSTSKPPQPPKAETRQPDKVTIKGNSNHADHDGDRT